MAILGSSFYPKLVELASEVGMQPEDIIAIMISESGMNPSAYNSTGSGASGLIQFTDPKSVGFGGSLEQLRLLSGEQQLPYVKKYIENQMRVNGGPFTSAAQYYVAVYWPAALRLPGVRQGDPNTPIVEKNPRTVRDPQNGKLYSKKYYDVGFKIDPGFERKAYEQNPLFHGDTPGVTTYGDMMKQVEKNRRNPLYRRALLAMQQDTGYNPQPASPSMLAQKTTPSRSKDNFNDVLNRLLSLVSPQTATASKKAYKKLFPPHPILIKIGAPDYTSAIEFSRVLCAALDEELMADSYPHTDGTQVEVECAISGPSEACLAAVEQLTEVMTQFFRTTTDKIGGIKIQTMCIMNKQSSYQPISLTTASTQYRKFLLKFM